MKCRECDEFLVDYVAGDLAPDVVATFELHLSRCRNCKVYLDQYLSTIKAGRKFEANVTPIVPFLRALMDVKDAKLQILSKLPGGNKMTAEQAGEKAGAQAHQAQTSAT